MTWIPIALISLTVLLAIANLVAWFRSRPSRRTEPVYHFNCPACNQRLRYRARQVGNPGQCPRCKKRWTFPPVPVKAGKS